MADEALDPTDDTLILLAELEEIRRRRELLGLNVSDLNVSARPFDRGTTGLAFSGGGIRSACFALGVAQALARHGRFSGFDYLSTVSGGGFFGSGLSSLVGSAAPAPETPPSSTDGDSFPFRLGVAEAEPAPLMHLRSFASFLTPEGAIGRLRLFAVLLRGVVLNVFLLLPWILGAVALTEISYEVESRLGITHLSAWVAAAVVAATTTVMITFPFVVRLARGRFTWDHRNQYEMLLARAVGLCIAVVMFLPFDLLLRAILRRSWDTVRQDLLALLGRFDSIPVWATIGGLLLLWTVLQSRFPWVSRMTSAMGNGALWVMGPALLLGSYLLLCARFVHLPMMTIQVPAQPPQAVTSTPAPGYLPDNLRAAVNSRLREEGGKLSSRATVTLDSHGSRLVISDPSERPARLADQLVGPPNGPGNNVGEARFPVDIADTDGVRSITVTLRQYPEPRDLLLLIIFLVIVVINGRLVDVNVTSLHEFYRDRLSRAFLLRRNRTRVDGNDRQLLSDLNPSGMAPYHLLNATINVSGSRNPIIRGRCADFFLFSKHFSGSRCTGYCPTTLLESADPRLDLASAAAISGGAAGPRMGVRTIDSMAGNMALFDLRLGYWLPNPNHVMRSTFGYGFSGPGPSYLLREALGVLHERGRYVNVSDGGHIENLGVYELLRRRCRLIVAVDAESDPSLTCDAVATLIRYARIDLGIVIEIDMTPLRPDASANSQSHWAVGHIHYDDRNADTGYLVYLKSSVTGDENDYLTAFRRQVPDFPQESTADQFFDEVHFEVYRALGDHIASGAINDAGHVGELLRSIGKPLTVSHGAT